MFIKVMPKGTNRCRTPILFKKLYVMLELEKPDYIGAIELFKKFQFILDSVKTPASIGGGNSVRVDSPPELPMFQL
ncbi:hypothetical protein SOV_20640 [Sporomusa ovata DSM 2662]|nr:hypothetical protein [Sporomusa ovata]EQB25387.1 hypothetical protein SOV_4c00430 [Sporomusa ovata DSM 2662]